MKFRTTNDKCIEKAESSQTRSAITDAKAIRQFGTSAEQIWRDYRQGVEQKSEKTIDGMGLVSLISM